MWPFWLFDSDIQADFVYDAVRSHMAIVGDNEITTIEHYRAARSGTMAFDKIPADGSTKMEDRYMDAIEPFNYDELEPFTRAYLPGFLAEKYDVDAEESIARVSERINKSVALAMSTTLPYDQYTPTHQHVALTDKSARYALLPGVDADDPVAGQDLHLRDERPDRAHGRRSADLQGARGGLVLRDHGGHLCIAQRAGAALVLGGGADETIETHARCAVIALCAGAGTAGLCGAGAGAGWRRAAFGRGGAPA